ncbi:MAG: hypothetical protein Q9M32_01570 [Sulfurimonas sp.]|nr:hypothetical protein [Sulfurimonas sp.]
MAHKNNLKKTRYDNIYELEMSNGKINYIAKFIHNNERFAGRNLTKIFGVTTAALADKKLDWIRIKLSEGVDVFNRKSNKVQDLLFNYLDTRSDTYNKRSRIAYNKHIKPIIGHLLITKVTREHFNTIKMNMENLGLASATIKKIKTILNPIFNEAFEDEIIKRNVLKSVKMGSDIVKPKLTDRLNEPLIQAARKIYNTSLLEENDYNLFFLISTMCIRRFGEIAALQYEDIINGVVNVRYETIKSDKKQHLKSIVEQYPLPKEVLDIIGTEKKSGKLFKHYYRTYMDRYASMIENKAGLDCKLLAKEFPIRSHDNRNFITSIMSKKYGIDYVGIACLSHTKEKSNVNVRYHSIEYEDREEVYNGYWEILRGSD